MRKALLLAAILLCLCLPVWSEAQSCDGCGIGYFYNGVPATGGTFTGPLTLPWGTASVVSLRFNTPGFNNYGWYTPDGGTWDFSYGGGVKLRLNSNIQTANDTTVLSFGTTSDVSIGRDAAASLQLGSDAATAVAQTLKGSDSTGANITGGNLTIRAGAGTSGNATGGQLILGGGANAGSGERGAVAFEDGGTQPTCAAGIRGSVWYDAGGAGVADKFEVCAKAAADTYAWRVLATIP